MSAKTKEITYVLTYRVSANSITGSGPIKRTSDVDEAIDLVKEFAEKFPSVRVDQDWIPKDDEWFHTKL